ncbi:HNH endonuclease family protein [Segniliparus rugosus]|uniref:GmrSD restriction endonucleases C-terminal domain-containing protein n=1 Tax=Segniliparus rugosus (strain ATCC BAA-974 / DSM 45345 / CCUG 50838 / CIP 108380 / JCM 13579 / CDC 945) TaxID=679197 RepID=E5XMH4_SEGRC|nr:hypothetical protein HMPREF9336_00694 [Segniliparus rugosus ATCC BAA-974]
MVRGATKSARHKPTRYAAVFAALAVAVAVQLHWERIEEAFGFGGPSAAQAGQQLGLRVVETRPRARDYRRSEFGEAWTDDTDAPLGRNGCDTRNDVLDRDLTHKQYVAIRRCPQAVASGDLHDPYTGRWVHFQRGKDTSAKVQIDHIVPLAYAWDMGARNWAPEVRRRFANDPANLVAVDGDANEDKGDQPPGLWMPKEEAFRCPYARQFAAVAKAYDLAVDARSAKVIAKTVQECPAG